MPEGKVATTGKADGSLIPNLKELSEEALKQRIDAIASREAALRAQMLPLEQQLSALAQEKAPLLTEARRRQREVVRLARAQVRQEAKEGGLLPLATALLEESLDPGLRISDLALFLRTGGKVQVGFAARPGQLTFTDGVGVRTAATVGEATSLLVEGWRLGTATVPGIRTHLPGTKIEKVVPETDVLVSPDGTAPA